MNDIEAKREKLRDGVKDCLHTLFHTLPKHGEKGSDLAYDNMIMILRNLVTVWDSTKKDAPCDSLINTIIPPN